MQNRIWRTPHSEAHSPFVWDVAGRFEQDEARFGVMKVNPPACKILQQPLVVALPVSAEQAQTQSSLSLDCPMAKPTVAT